MRSPTVGAGTLGTERRSALRYFQTDQTQHIRSVPSGSRPAFLKYRVELPRRAMFSNQVPTIGSVGAQISGRSSATGLLPSVPKVP